MNNNLPRVSMIATTSSHDYYDAGIASNLPIESITAAVKKSLGYLEKPLIKCKHCGQWGAAYCACKHCGAPIDPKE